MCFVVLLLMVSVLLSVGVLFVSLLFLYGGEGDLLLLAMVFLLMLLLAGVMVVLSLSFCSEGYCDL